MLDAKLLLLAMGALSLVSNAFASDMKRWTYAVPNQTQLVVLSHGSVIDGAEVLPAKSCTKSSGFICFSSDVVSFAISRDIRKQHQWRYDGVGYCVQQVWELKQDVVYQVLGFADDHVCDGNGNPPDVIVIYSKTHGVRYVEAAGSFRLIALGKGFPL